MIKSELVRKLSLKYPTIPLDEIDNMVNSLFEEMADGLANGRVELRGFGAFSLRQRKARTARNPKTNERVQLEERKAIHFKLGKDLKERINS